MQIAISTNWNVKRHTSGEALADEALSLGFDALELSYNMREEIMPGIRTRMRQGAIAVNSVHAFCPVPLGVPHGSPELHHLASDDDDERAMAAILLAQTLDFARSVNARAIVLHAGRIFLDSIFGDLDSCRLEMIAGEQEGGVSSPAYQKALKRAKARRGRRAAKRMVSFSETLERVLPSFEKAGLLLCLENLPSLEGFPDEEEMQILCSRFKDSPLRCWHDMGHGQVRYQMGWTGDPVGVAQKLLPLTGGIHIHDSAPLTVDHLPPGHGKIPFPSFSFFNTPEIIKVFEPAPNVPPDVLAESLKYIRKVWAQEGDAEVKRG